MIPARQASVSSRRIVATDGVSMIDHGNNAARPPQGNSRSQQPPSWPQQALPPPQQPQHQPPLVPQAVSIQSQGMLRSVNSGAGSFNANSQHRRNNDVAPQPNLYRRGAPPNLLPPVQAAGASSRSGGPSVNRRQIGQSERQIVIQPNALQQPAPQLQPVLLANYGMHQANNMPISFNGQPHLPFQQMGSIVLSGPPASALVSGQRRIMPSASGVLNAADHRRPPPLHALSQPSTVQMSLPPMQSSRVSSPVEETPEPDSTTADFVVSAIDKEDDSNSTNSASARQGSPPAPINIQSARTNDNPGPSNASIPRPDEPVLEVKVGCLVDTVRDSGLVSY